MNSTDDRKYRFLQGMLFEQENQTYYLRHTHKPVYLVFDNQPAIAMAALLFQARSISEVKARLYESFEISVTDDEVEADIADFISMLLEEGFLEFLE